MIVNTVKYYYDTEGKMTKKVITPSGGSAQTIYYETNDDNTVVKFSAGGRTVTSHSKTDSFGRKVFDELQLGTDFVSRQFVYHVGKVTAEHKDKAKVKSSATTQLVSQIILSNGTTLSYGYDAEERITSVVETYTVDDTPVTNTTIYTYDALGQILTETVNGEVVNTMKYDNYGNIVEKNGKAYTYGDAKWKDLLTSYNGQAIEYDAQGNPISYLGHTLTWERGCQLKKFDNVEYTYNANGIRTSKTIDGVTHTYTLEGTKILKETWDTNTLIPLYDNEDTVCGILYNNTPYYFLKNIQGDTIAIVDSKENVIANYTYDAWGKIISINGENLDIANINPFRYRGYYYDTEIDMYYLQSRYYDPQTGRFINADVAEYVLNTHNAISSNLFTYCYNTPVNGVDTFGFCGTTFRPVYRYTPPKINSTNNSKIDYSNDNWIAKFLGVKTKFTTGFDVLGASFKLTLSAGNASSGIKITKDSFTYNFSSGSLSLGWNGKLEGGFGLSFGRYSISYLKGIDWQKSYLAVSISCTSKDGKREFECELYFSMSHLLKLTIAVLVVGACVVVPALAPVCTRFTSIITAAAKSIYPLLTALIPMFELASMQLKPA